MNVEFLVTSLIVATPGTGVLYTVAAGLTRGARASIVAALGCTLGIVPHMAAATPYSTATTQIPTTVRPSERAAWGLSYVEGQQRHG